MDCPPMAWVATKACRGASSSESTSSFGRDRRTGIAIDAALALTGVEVAQEVLFKYIECYECIVYLYHNDCLYCCRLYYFFREEGGYLKVAAFNIVQVRDYSVGISLFTFFEPTNA